MKEPWDWEENDIELLIKDRVQESLNLDYKDSRALCKTDHYKKELSKDVSAFANSAGGVIIYGVTELNNLPTGIDNGFDPTDITREWIEQTINSNIQRRIDGIRIKQIELKSKNNGRVIYAISIPQSNHAPHMTNHTFYKRFNYESRKMEEYEVRDVSRRADAPDLSIKFFPENFPIKLEFKDGNEFSEIMKLQAFVTNESIAPAMYSVVRLYIDKRINVNQSGDFSKSYGDISISLGSISIITDSYSRNLITPHNLPIWNGINFLFSDLDFLITFPNIDMVYFVAWSIDSIGMQQKSKKCSLTVFNSQVVILND